MKCTPGKEAERKLSKEIDMEKMISPQGIKANMCCASCIHSTYKSVLYRVKKWCVKKDKPILNLGNKCGYYAMAEFFQKRGYEPIKD